MWTLIACAPEAPAPPVEPAPVEPVEVAAPVEPPAEIAAETAPAPVDEDDALAGTEEVGVQEEDALPAPLDSLPSEAWTDREDVVNELSGLTLGVQVVLVEDARVLDVPCKGEQPVVALHDGRWSCVLSEPATVADWPLDRGARVSMYTSGGVAQVTFGDLRSPRESVTVGGVPCLSQAALHPEGTVRSCTLARGAKLGATPLPKGADVTLRPDGGLIDATVYDATTIAGQRYEAGLLLFDGSGAVSGHQPGVFGD